MSTKQSQAELIRLLESGIREVGNLDPTRFFIIVRHVEVSGKPPNKLIGWVLVRFLPTGAPWCCGEPLCYSRVFGDSGELADHIGRKMNLDQEMSVELKIATEYYEGIRFTKT